MKLIVIVDKTPTSFDTHLCDNWYMYKNELVYITENVEEDEEGEYQEKEVPQEVVKQFVLKKLSS